MSKHLALGITVLHQLVIELVQLFLVVLVPLAFCLPGSQTTGIIRVGLEWSHLGNGIGLALKWNLCGSKQLLIFRYQLIGFLHQRHHLRLEASNGKLRVTENHIPVLLRKVRCKWTIHQCGFPLIGQLLQLWHGLIPVILLCLPVCVPGIDGMMDGSKLCHGSYMIAVCVIFYKYCIRLCEGLGSL